MMMCVQLDMKEEFDRIWKWSKTYMYMEEGENEGYFAWSCQTDGTKNAYGPAPDGEEFFAMALFFASHRWGDGEGIFNYSEQAREILKACLHKGENGREGTTMWNKDNHQILFVPGSPHTDPSYHLPHFYELFALWANEEDREFFKEAARASREYLVKACHPVTGLSAEYANFDGTPYDEKLPWGYYGDFFSDAYRTAANIGLDAIWYGEDFGQLSAPLKMMKFFGTDLEAARCTYKIDGTPVERCVLHPVGLLATIAQGALAVPYSEEMDSDFEVAKKWVDTACQKLDIDVDSALEMWLEDNDYLENQEQNELDKKAKENKIKLGATEKTERKKVVRERKPNIVKENIIKNLESCVKSFATNVKVENVGKIITFSYENKQFKIDLTEKRVKKCE